MASSTDFAGNYAFGEKTFGQIQRLGREFQVGNSCQFRQAAGRRGCIARPRLPENPLRDEQAEPVTMVVPPIASQLLVCGNQQVAAGP